MPEDASTKPTIETVLERIAELQEIVVDANRNMKMHSAKIESHPVSAQSDIATIKEEQKRQALQLDRLAKHVHELGVELYNLRDEFHKTSRATPQ